MSDAIRDLYVRFRPAYAQRNAPMSFDGKPFEFRTKAYASATPVLVHLKTTLVEKHGWKEVEKQRDTILFHIQHPRTKASIILPTSPFTFATEKDKYREMFTAGAFKTIYDPSGELLIGGPGVPGALSSIFYLLQLVIPGMLGLMLDDNTASDTTRVSRYLPPLWWMAENEHDLTHIFGAIPLVALQHAAGSYWPPTPERILL
ncbi:hypothetical protein SISNIDRAFT_464225 [Sistotremastrum niveocremeum HHB9708]|uniref:Uncharacterized protein n=2 Tax=Sistotremastraceae TaxID=3402574 RepID=A0A164XG33_9AGAM|nr:hypothetical protein SISNIDRAFT_464225 [Sistotremastrum niveocremeum HHB9708]KZT41333.1 hypothetical protein SISSUDRAFT_1031234 [Sistotremastrum suecicum HHB10207 ss-3]